MKFVEEYYDVKDKSDWGPGPWEWGHYRGRGSQGANPATAGNTDKRRIVLPDDIENRFAYHAPTGDKVQRHESVRDECKTLAHTLNLVLSDGREKSLAITHLENVMMWANASIARGE